MFGSHLFPFCLTPCFHFNLYFLQIYFFWVKKHYFHLSWKNELQILKDYCCLKYLGLFFIYNNFPNIYDDFSDKKQFINGKRTTWKGESLAQTPNVLKKWSSNCVHKKNFSLKKSDCKPFYDSKCVPQEKNWTYQLSVNSIGKL